MANKKFLTDNDIEYTIEELEDIVYDLNQVLEGLYENCYTSEPATLSKILNGFGKKLIKLSINLY